MEEKKQKVQNIDLLMRLCIRKSYRYQKMKGIKATR